jgi:hypothetical protein
LPLRASQAEGVGRGGLYSVAADFIDHDGVWRWVLWSDSMVARVWGCSILEVIVICFNIREGYSAQFSSEDTYCGCIAYTPGAFS